MISDIVTKNKTLPDSIIRDMIVAQVTLKYTQSNSVCVAYDGQVIGVGAGQQSRIHCTRLASSKAKTWWLRQHPSTVGLKFKKGVKRPDKNNGVDLYLRDDLTDIEEKMWQELFKEVPIRLTASEKESWIKGITGITMASDGFFPFRDNIDHASTCGIKYVVQPGGSIADPGIIEACDDYDMVMVNSGIRVFHH